MEREQKYKKVGLQKSDNGCVQAKEFKRAESSIMLTEQTDRIPASSS
jgi:hypothetical protein